MRTLSILSYTLVGATLVSAVPFKGFIREMTLNSTAGNNITAHGSHVAAVSPSDLFRFTSPSSATGHTNGPEICTNGQKDAVNTWLADIGLMLSTIFPALERMESGEHNQELQKNLYDWFGIRNLDEGKQDFDDVKEMYDLVQTFLNQRMQSLLGDHKPWLYCDSTWLQEMDIVYDIDGNPEMYRDSNGNMVVMGPRTTPPNVVTSHTLQEQLSEWQEKEPNGDWSYYPYYAPDHKEAVTEPYGHQYKGDPPSFCNGVAGDEAGDYQEGRYVGLDENAIPTITLCPRTFTVAPITLQNALDSPKMRGRGTLLGDVLPQSLVLFHELMHAVDPESSPDNCCKAVSFKT